MPKFLATKRASITKSTTLKTRMSNKIRVGVLGSAGYTGGELLRLLVQHPGVELVFAHSHSQAGKKWYHTHPDLLGETEAVHNTLSPEWTTTIRLPEYEMGNPTRLAVNIYDHSNNSSSNKKSMGCVMFDVSDILAANGQIMGRRLKDGKGTVYASLRPLRGEDSGVIRLTLQCRNLPNVESSGRWRRDKSDPFLVLSRPIVRDGSNADDGGHAWDSVFRSAVRTLKKGKQDWMNVVCDLTFSRSCFQPAMNNLDPKFDVSMELSTLCSGNLDAPVLVSVYDFVPSGHHVDIGSVHTTLNELLAMASASESSSELTLVSSDERLDSGSAAGTISVLKAQVTGIKEPSSTTVSGNAGDALSDQVAAVSIDELSSANPPLLITFELGVN